MVGWAMENVKKINANGVLNLYIKICGITWNKDIMYIYVHTSYYETFKSFGHCSPYIQFFEEICAIYIEAQNT